MPSPQLHAEPRNFTAVGPLPGAGLPQERLARIAARRAFVDLKADFIAAVAHLGDGEWLKRQVRQAQQPLDLYLLRSAVYTALAHAVGGGERRQRLQRTLATAFPPSGFSPSGFANF